MLEFHGCHEAMEMSGVCVTRNSGSAGEEANDGEMFMAGRPAGLLTASHGRGFSILVTVSNCELRDRPLVVSEISHC